MKKIKRISALLLTMVMMLSVFSMTLSASALDETGLNTDPGITLYWNNASAGSKTWTSIISDISSYSNTSYAGYNNYGTYKTYAGKTYTFAQLLIDLGKSTEWTSAPDTTVVTITSGSDTISFTKAQLMATRYYYNASGVRGTSVIPGFMYMVKSTGNQFKFVFGQTARYERNVPSFYDFNISNDVVIYVDTTTTPAQANPIIAYVNRSTSAAYYTGSTISVNVGDTLDFNISDTSFLNSGMIFYNYGTGTVSDPSCSDNSTSYIRQTPKFGGLYRSITFEEAGTYTVKAIGLKYGNRDGYVCTFTVTVSE